MSGLNFPQSNTWLPARSQNREPFSSFSWQSAEDFNPQGFWNLKEASIQQHALEPGSLQNDQPAYNAGSFPLPPSYQNSGSFGGSDLQFPSQYTASSTGPQSGYRPSQHINRSMQEPTRYNPCHDSGAPLFNTPANGPYRMPGEMRVSSSSGVQLPSPAFPMPLMRHNSVFSTSPYVGGYHQNRQATRFDARTRQLELEEYSATLPDSRMNYSLPNNPYRMNPRGYHQNASFSDVTPGIASNNGYQQESSCSNKIPDVGAATPTPGMFNLGGDLKQVPEVIAKSGRISTAEKGPAETLESDVDEMPIPQTRQLRWRKKHSLDAAAYKDAPTASASVKPALLMANGQLSESPYVKGGGIREPVPPKTPSDLFFNTYEEARRGVGKLSWMPPIDDPTLPTNEAELRPYVLELREAMKDMSAYVGKPGSKMKNRWLPKDYAEGQSPKNGDTLQNSYNPEHFLELRAWQIASACQRLHRDGPGFIDCLDPLLLEQSFDYRDLTFRERINRLISACKHCKDRVGAMLKLGMGAVLQYLLAPGDLVDSSKGNRANNDVRQGRLEGSRLLERQANDSPASTAASQAKANMADPKFAHGLAQSPAFADDRESDLSDHNSSEFDLDTIAATMPPINKAGLKRKCHQVDVGESTKSERKRGRNF